MQQQIDQLTDELATIATHLTNAANRTAELLIFYSAGGAIGDRDSSVH